MSSEKGNTSEGAKKRRVQRACDACRRKKIRCDSGKSKGDRCSNCFAYNYSCTYEATSKRSTISTSYVKELETRLEKMEELVQKLSSDRGAIGEITRSSPSNQTWSSTEAASGLFSKPSLLELHCSPQVNNQSTSTPTTSHDGGDEDEDPLGDDEYVDKVFLDRFAGMGMGAVQDRFFGKSSGLVLLQKAANYKKACTGVDHQFPEGKPESVKSWEQPWKGEQGPSGFDFPDDDLMSQLIDFYFEHVNRYLPLLHRPTFEQSIAQGLHHEDAAFAKTVLLVSALGSRYTNDPRVFVTMEGEGWENSNGWKWAHQSHRNQKSFLEAPNVYDLQVFALLVIFLHSSKSPQPSWTIVGVGIRVAQEIGAHRCWRKDSQPSANEELMKRAFWILVFLDRGLSLALGRPTLVQDEDLDLEFPIECDDEFWDHPDPDQRFKQPPGKPSHMSYFVSLLKLSKILNKILRDLYSVAGSNAIKTLRPGSEQQVVAELDSSLNNWIDSIPDHLRWDPQREDRDFFRLSATLYCNYYFTQIMIHRPFIPVPGKPSPLLFPSLAICTNAARSCIHVIGVFERRKIHPPALVMAPMYTSAIVLLLSIWGGKKVGINTDRNKAMADIQICVRVLETNFHRMHATLRFLDVLKSLASTAELPLSDEGTSPTQKRGWDEHESPLYEYYGAQPSSGDPRPIAGSVRVAKFEDRQNLTLPVHSEDLGRLPLDGQFTFAAEIPSTSSWGFPVGEMGTLATLGSQYPYEFPLEDLFQPRLNGEIEATHRVFDAGQGSGQSWQSPGGGLEYQTQALGNDIVSVWSSAPTGFGLEDWGLFADNVGTSRMN